ncbi:MAG: hypothetical protein AB1730_24940 [Myxococcota bacterium]
MNPLIAIVAVIGSIPIVAFIAIGIYLVYLSDKKRTEALQQYAQSHGLVFEGQMTELGQWVQGFKLFNQGRSRLLKNVMRGAKERASLGLGDYEYTTGSGRNTTIHRQTVCVVRHPGLAVPHFFLRRQLPFFDAIGKLFGGQDLNFDEDPAFSKAFVLQTSGHESEVRRYFNERARAHFTALAEKYVQVEAVGDTLLLHYGKRLDVKALDGLVADAVNTARLWAGEEPSSGAGRR